MAKPLNERIASAQATDRVTITDLENLINEVAAERDRHSNAAIAATADSIRFELSEEDRDEAARAAERAKRNSLAMASALESLAVKLEAKRSSEAQRSQRAARERALAERDAIAERFKAEWPGIEAHIVELLSASKANAEHMRSLEIYEANAEAVARSMPGNFIDTVGPLRQLAELCLPSFSSPRELAWPQIRPFNYNLGREEAIKAKNAVEAEQRRWQRYMVTPPAGLRAAIKLLMRNGPDQVREAPVIGRMTEEGVADARAKGCTVEPVAANVSIGLPSGVASF